MKCISFAVVLSLVSPALAFAADAAADSASPRPPMCVSPRDIASTTPLSDREILFKMRNGKMWLNTLPQNCPGLKFEGGFIWEIHGDSICAKLQTFRVLRRGTVCMLGEFSPYTPPPKAGSQEDAPAQD
jgi:hypothetical protein